MIKRIFVDHPQTVGETYGEHFIQASGFSARMFAGALACFFHGLVPCLFTSTGSDTIRTLHDRMIENRHRQIRGHDDLPAGIPAGSKKR